MKTSCITLCAMFAVAFTLFVAVSQAQAGPSGKLCAHPGFEFTEARFPVLREDPGNGFSGALLDQAVHRLADAAVGGVTLRGGAQLDHVHRLARIHLHVVAQAVGQEGDQVFPQSCATRTPSRSWIKPIEVRQASRPASRAAGIRNPGSASTVLMLAAVPSR